MRSRPVPPRPLVQARVYQPERSGASSALTALTLTALSPAGPPPDAAALSALSALTDRADFARSALPSATPPGGAARPAAVTAPNIPPPPAVPPVIPPLPPPAVATPMVGITPPSFPPAGPLAVLTSAAAPTQLRSVGDIQRYMAIPPNEDKNVMYAAIFALLEGTGTGYRKCSKHGSRGVYHVVCSNAGYAEKKKTDLKHRRNRKSLRCGCKFKIAFELNNSTGMFAVKDTKSLLQHTEGCVPSLQMEMLHRYRRGVLPPKPVWDLALKTYLGGGTPPGYFKRLFEKHRAPSDPPVTPQRLANLMSKLRSRAAVTDPATLEQLALAPEVQVRPHSVGEQISSILREEPEHSMLVHLLRKWKSTHAGFDYTMMVREDGTLEGLFFATSRMQQRQREYPAVLFLGSTAMVNKEDYPMYLPCVVDAFGKVVVIGCAIMKSDGRDHHKFVMDCIKSNSVTSPRVVFTDGKIEENLIKLVFGKDVSALLCCFHLGAVKSLSHLTEYQEMKDYFDKELMEARSEAHFDAAWAVVQKKWSTACGFLQKRVEERHRWAHPWRGARFNCGMQSASVSDAIIASFKAFFDEMGDIVHLVGQVLMWEAMNEHSERTRIAAFVVHNKISASTKDSMDMTKRLSSYILEKYEGQLRDSEAYKVEEIADHSWLVQVPGQKSGPRTVTRAPRTPQDDTTNDTTFSCSCLMPVGLGMPCRHTIAVRKHLNLAIDVTCFHKRWLVPTQWVGHALEDVTACEMEPLRNEEKIVRTPPLIRVQDHKRPPRPRRISDRPKNQRQCSYCGKTDHKINRCPQLEGFELSHKKLPPTVPDLLKNVALAEVPTCDTVSKVPRKARFLVVRASLGGDMYIVEVRGKQGVLFSIAGMPSTMIAEWDLANNNGRVYVSAATAVAAPALIIAPPGGPAPGKAVAMVNKSQAEMMRPLAPGPPPAALAPPAPRPPPPPAVLASAAVACGPPAPAPMVTRPPVPTRPAPAIAGVQPSAPTIANSAPVVPTSAPAVPTQPPAIPAGTPALPPAIPACRLPPAIPAGTPAIPPAIPAGAPVPTRSSAVPTPLDVLVQGGMTTNAAAVAAFGAKRKREDDGGESLAKKAKLMAGV